jgi:hypothetical protein
VIDDCDLGVDEDQVGRGNILIGGKQGGRGGGRQPGKRLAAGATKLLIQHGSLNLGDELPTFSIVRLPLPAIDRDVVLEALL